ncbi:UNVERIFIED_CONTAM: hypothetical protein Slati_0070700 [Sesamum latifolium]|uniref:RNase H type-1 domain-containing protein n=1 Tax=Sesamum latifolium TaxID=2727402 RepID=A0AAW2Y7M0_9LAMI
MFSVRSAYHLACELEDRPCSSYREPRDHWWWRKLWQASLPNKIKVFVWRVCLNALPTGVNLAKRLRDCPGECPLCQSKDIGCWAQEVSTHLNGDVPRMVPSVTAPSSWQAPPVGVVKINFDGATFVKGKKLGVGVVARNSLGQCVAWVSRRLGMAGTSVLAEALAAREAVLLAVRRGWRHVIVEGDCSTLVQKLQSRERDLSAEGPIVTDVLNLAVNFLSCEFNFVKRSNNRVAHFFTHFSGVPAEGDVDIPPAVVPFVNSDLIS